MRTVPRGSMLRINMMRQARGSQSRSRDEGKGLIYICICRATQGTDTQGTDTSLLTSQLLWCCLPGFPKLSFYPSLESSLLFLTPILPFGQVTQPGRPRCRVLGHRAFPGDQSTQDVPWHPQNSWVDPPHLSSPTHLHPDGPSRRGKGCSEPERRSGGGRKGYCRGE